MPGYDHDLGLFGDEHLTKMWRHELRTIVRHERSAPAVAGLALRLLHDCEAWPVDEVAASFPAPHPSGSARRGRCF
jgi:hypothetical protein